MVRRGLAALVETRGRRSGRPARAVVGYVTEPDGSLLVAAGASDAAWSRNLEADPQCRATIGERTIDCLAETLTDEDRAAAIVELILKYGTPSERLGEGLAFRLRPSRGSSPVAPETESSGGG